MLMTSRGVTAAAAAEVVVVGVALLLWRRDYRRLDLPCASRA